MTPTQVPDQTSPSRFKRILLAIILPLISCSFSSFVGLILGQIGNAIYKELGEFATCLSIPGFLSLFVLTFGISYFSTRFFRKKLNRSAS